MAFLAAILAAAALHGTELPRTTIQVGRVHVRTELAVTDAARERGLMYRRSLAPRSGMLFVFADPVTAGFWMKNTRIALSIAFLDGGGRILAIRRMAPCPQEPCPIYGSPAPYRLALEVNAGSFARWKARTGMRVAFPPGILALAR